MNGDTHEKRRRSRSFGLLFLVTLAACAPARVDDPHDRIREDVRNMAQAMKSGKFDRIVELTHPAVVEKLGGADKMIEMLESSPRWSDADGNAVGELRVDSISDTYPAGSETLVVVRTTMTAAVKDGSLRAESFMIGASSDGGKSWSYVDGSMIDDRSLRGHFPDLGPELVVPESKRPEFHKN